LEVYVDEQQAIARLKRGDIGGLAGFVRRYEVQAVRTAYLITHDRALAEDVVQSAFLTAYHSIGTFDASRSFGPGFLRSVANAAVQAARRQARDLSLDAPSRSGDWMDDDSVTLADLLANPAPGPDDEAEAAELRQAVWEALGKLSPEQRAAVVLRYYLDLSEREMADELDVPPGTVKWRLHAARKQLRVWLYRLGFHQSRPDWEEGV
jgi:RNA polymerase sigma-70 factor (ECF subfamily)